MKISLRILLINFLIVVLILGSSFFIFYTIVYEVLTTFQTRNLRQSANNFTYVYRSLENEAEEDFLSIYNNGIETFLREKKFLMKNIDFILEEGIDSESKISRYLVSSNVYLPDKEFNLKDFQNYNPNLMMMSFVAPDGRKYLYGRAINTERLNDISQRINSDIALISNGYTADFSNQIVNQKYIYILNQAVYNLKNKNNFELYIQGTESKDILATIYKPAGMNSQDNLYYLIFTTFGEAGELRSTLKTVFIVIGLAGVSLSLIFTFLFTDKLRKQITDLSDATQQTYWGNYEYKINVKSNDEIGKLGFAFNKMLDELQKKEVAKNEYAEFITLINQNPSLKEISDVALKKILHSADFLIGGLYVVDNEITLVSAYGLDVDNINRPDVSEFIKEVLETKRNLEIYNEDSLPVVTTGLLDIKIKYLLFLPILYNNKPVALLELGSLAKPSEEVRDYLEKIKEQLAIGITNARALLQLENLVSELKQLNEEYHKQNVQIKEQNQTLLQLSYELKLQTEELEKQKQRALELTEAKSKFLANMSHELRTPMNSILGLTELMLEKADLEPRNKERLEVVLNSGKRLMTLINDILDLSKIEAGKMEIRYEDVLLDDILEEISGAIIPLANVKNIDYKIIKNIDTHTLINTDRGKVIQVLINLLGNAVKYTDKGEVTLRVSVGGEMLNFDVVDTGIGISEDEIDLIFEEFRQVSHPKSRRRGGTGLGLAISKKLADILGGKLKVVSELNKGSVFTFSVPFKQVQLLLPEAYRGRVNIQKLKKNRRNPILVIDDEEEVRYTIGQYLLSLGYEVSFAEDGIDGLKMAIENQPYAIILDIMLPQKDGWSVLKELKENSVTKDIPVILVSIVADQNLGYSLGAFDYALKPISSHRLKSIFSKLENLVKRKIEKIVIVDNDELEFQKLKKEFASDNITIDFLRDSENAFSRISDIEPDLVIINLVMSKVDGITLTYLLKSDFKTKHIPIIISTDGDITEDEKKSLANVVEEIAIKSKGYPDDILKMLKNRIEMQERVEFAEVSDSLTAIKEESEKSKNVEEIPEFEQSATLEVLIVDDDPNTLYTLDQIVRNCNCKTILAKNGKECLEILENKIPDLVLLDIIMPEMDGFQTIKLMKRNKKWTDIPVFAVTAKAMKDDNEIILKHGFSDFIPKPFNPAFVSYKIQRIVSQLKTT